MYENWCWFILGVQESARIRSVVSHWLLGGASWADECGVVSPWLEIQGSEAKCSINKEEKMSPEGETLVGKKAQSCCSFPEGHEGEIQRTHVVERQPTSCSLTCTCMPQINKHNKNQNVSDAGSDSLLHLVGFHGRDMPWRKKWLSQHPTQMGEEEGLWPRDILGSKKLWLQFCSVGFLGGRKEQGTGFTEEEGWPFFEGSALLVSAKHPVPFPLTSNLPVSNPYGLLRALAGDFRL